MNRKHRLCSVLGQPCWSSVVDPSCVSKATLEPAFLGVRHLNGTHGFAQEAKMESLVRLGLADL